MTIIPTIYAVAAEDSSFILHGTAVPSTFGSGTFRTGWARGAISINGSAAADPPTNRAETYPFFGGGKSIFWVHGRMSWGPFGGNSSTNCVLLRCLDAGTARLCVRGTGTSGQLKVDTRDAGGTFTNLFTTPTNVMPSGGLSTVPYDLSVVYAAGDVVAVGPTNDISFIYGDPPIIHSTNGDFSSPDFTKGCIVIVSGSVSNDGQYDVALANGTDLTLIRGEVLNNETAGATVSVTIQGSVSLYINSVRVGRYVGNVTTDGATTLDSVDLASPDNSNGVYWSELIVSDLSTLNAGVWTAPPTGTGHTQNWNGVVADIDAFQINDANFVGTDATAEVSDWTISTSPPSGSWLVGAVVEEVRIACGVSGPQSFDFTVYTGGTEEVSAGTTLTLAFQNFQHVWAENPLTSLPWTLADLGSGFNIGIESDV